MFITYSSTHWLFLSPHHVSKPAQTIPLNYYVISATFGIILLYSFLILSILVTPISVSPVSFTKFSSSLHHHTLIQLNGVGTVFHYVVVKIHQLFLQPAACLTSTLLGNGLLTTANAGANGLSCLPNHEGRCSSPLHAIIGR
jgi:hypothetical protein